MECSATQDMQARSSLLSFVINNRGHNKTLRTGPSILLCHLCQLCGLEISCIPR